MPHDMTPPDVTPADRERIAARLACLDRERDALERLASRLMGLLQTVDDEHDRLQQRLAGPPSLLERARAVVGTPEMVQTVREPTAAQVQRTDDPQPSGTTAATVIALVSRPAPAPPGSARPAARRTIKLERVARRRPMPLLEPTPGASLEPIELPLVSRTAPPHVVDGPRPEPTPNQDAPTATRPERLPDPEPAAVVEAAVRRDTRPRVHAVAPPPAVIGNRPRVPPPPTIGQRTAVPLVARRSDTAPLYVR